MVSPSDSGPRDLIGARRLPARRKPGIASKGLRYSEAMPEPRRLILRPHQPFDLRCTLLGHGWVDLAPFAWDASAGELSWPQELGGAVFDVRVRQAGSRLVATAVGRGEFTATRAKALRRTVVRILRLDQDLSSFWRVCRRHPRFRWVARRRAGRLMVSGTLFEDLAKILLTTHCSWSATRSMCRRLCETWGRRAPSGRRAFPRPRDLARVRPDQMRRQARCGYRSENLVLLARAFAEGAPWRGRLEDPSVPVAHKRDVLGGLRGFGPYAVGQALRLLGHCEDLALDAWCRARLAELWGRETPPGDQEVEERYEEFGPWAGLALWMDLTRVWHERGGMDGGEIVTPR